MRWLEFVYNQYAKDTKDEIMLNASDATGTEEPNVGDVYAIGSLYYVVADTEEYPYEVFIASPYWELASDKDLIVDGADRRWVITSIVRYVSDEILSQSCQFDTISRKVLKIMRNYVEKGDPLPKEFTGLSYIEGKGFYQELFRNKEEERSRILLASLF